MPNSVVAGAMFVGVSLAWSGLETLATIGGLACSIVGLLMVVFGVQVAFAKYAERDGRSRR